MTLCPVPLQLCLCGRLRPIHTCHYVTPPLYSICYSHFSSSNHPSASGEDRNVSVFSSFWFCNGCLQKIALLKCVYLGVRFMLSLAACVLLDVCCYDVARECARKKPRLEPQRSACVCVLHQLHWPTKRGVEQMSWLCSTLIGHSLRLYPHFNWYNAV